MERKNATAGLRRMTEKKNTSATLENQRLPYFASRMITNTTYHHARLNNTGRPALRDAVLTDARSNELGFHPNSFDRVRQTKESMNGGIQDQHRAVQAPLNEIAMSNAGTLENPAHRNVAKAKRMNCPTASAIRSRATDSIPTCDR